MIYCPICSKIIDIHRSHCFHELSNKYSVAFFWDGQCYYYNWKLILEFTSFKVLDEQQIESLLLLK